jgi:2-C-methyl-D-erythritol 4-phosphate cytidylyltransferase
LTAIAIVVAAGRGERMGQERPKAFLELGGEPLLLRAARAFEAAPSVAGIVAVVPEPELEAARRGLAPLAKLRAVVTGGARRQDSVQAGLQQLPGDFDGVVLVHDAARPFVDVELVEAVAHKAWDAGAALPVLPLVDTVKRVRDGRVIETLDRAELGGAQTPQGFRVALLREACEAVRRDGASVTDEAMAVERLGHPVHVVPGSKLNRKLTTPDDLAWAESVVAGILRT